MNQKIRSELIRLAKLKRTTTYSELNQKLGLGYKFPRDIYKISNELEEISKFEFRHGRPPLSVLVNSKETDKPGKGFYRMCKDLYNQPSESLKSSSSFDIDLTAECFKVWRRIKNKNSK